MNNIFQIPGSLPDAEYTEALLPDKGILIERIISTGQPSPPGFWYNQDRDEWVAVLQGEAVIGWPDGRTVTLRPGDWLLIEAHQVHRVEGTSTNPPCIWLAVHGKLS